MAPVVRIPDDIVPVLSMVDPPQVAPVPVVNFKVSATRVADMETWYPQTYITVDPLGATIWVVVAVVISITALDLATLESWHGSLIAFVTNTF